MKIGFCTMEKHFNRKIDSVGSSRIRARWLVNYWPEAEEYKIGEIYDVLVFQKVYWFEMAKNFKGLKIFDICDPDWLEGARCTEMFQLCDAVVTSTEHLRDYIKKIIDKPVICIPDRIDFNEIEMVKQSHSDRIEKVVWFGYSSNQAVLDQTLDLIAENNYILRVISDKDYEPNKSFSIKLENLPYSYPAVNNQIIEADVALLPRIDKEKFIFKSNNKIVQCWALGIPVAQEPGDFDLLRTKADRERIAKENLAKARTEYDVQTSVEEYKKLIVSLQESKKRL